jgi:hypothetical protein
MLKKKKTLSNSGESTEVILLYSCGGLKNGKPFLKNHPLISSKTRHILCNDLDIALLNTYPRERRAFVYTRMCIVFVQLYL